MNPRMHFLKHSIFFLCGTQIALGCWYPTSGCFVWNLLPFIFQYFTLAESLLEQIFIPVTVSIAVAVYNDLKKFMFNDIKNNNRLITWLIKLNCYQEKLHNSWCCHITQKWFLLKYFYHCTIISQKHLNLKFKE